MRSSHLCGSEPLTGLSPRQLELQQRREGQVALIVRLLSRRFGDIDFSVIERVQGLSIEQLEALAEALLDFAGVTDLVTWLEQQERDRL